jgi:hypothetical protein
VEQRGCLRRVQHAHDQGVLEQGRCRQHDELRNKPVEDDEDEMEEENGRPTEQNKSMIDERGGLFFICDAKTQSKPSDPKAFGTEF